MSCFERLCLSVVAAAGEAVVSGVAEEVEDLTGDVVASTGAEGNFSY